MSTPNPYAAPKAPVADQPSPLPANFTPGGRSRPAGNGWRWIAEGWRIFRVNVGIWIAIAIVLALLLVLTAVPFVGALVNLALVFLGPVLTGGLMLGCRSVEEGHDMRFGHLFAGFGRSAGALVGVGAAYFVCGLAIVLIAIAVSGVGFATFFGGSPDQMVAAGMALLLAWLVMLALSIPVVMAMWFAPALIVLHDLPTLEAMKQSFKGCARNLLPFLVYGIVLFVFAVVASLPILLGWLALGPVMIASIYTSYRDIYLS